MDTDEARQTTSLILQQASVMAAEGSDKTPLIFATQTAATVADLDIEGLDPEEPAVSNVGSNISMSTTVGRTISSPEKTQIMSGVSASPSGSGYQVSSTPAGMIDPRDIFSTALSVVPGPSSVASVVPYDRGPRIIPPYNSSAMYEDSALPVYVDYIGNIMPILDRQSIETNWPPTRHPLTGQIKYVLFNIGNMPMVPYMMSVGSSLLLQPIRGQPALLEIAPETQPEVVGDSVSQINVIVTQTPATAVSTLVVASEEKQAKCWVKYWRERNYLLLKWS